MVGPALLSAATLATAAYLNARLSISTDLKQLSRERLWTQILQKRIQQLGETCSLYQIFSQATQDKEALWFEGRSWTYAELKREVDKFGAYLSENGVAQGNVVGVFTSNSPEMVIAILALSRLGAAAGLINTNLRDDTLKHCLDISTAVTVISTPDLAEHIKWPLNHLSINLSSFDAYLPLSKGILIDISTLPSPTRATAPAKGTPKSIFALIYTSGTTGKPKACAVPTMLVLVTSNPHMPDVLFPEKYAPLRTYCALPLFHATGLFGGPCNAFASSGTFCVARKFSASRFWRDVTESGATRIQYVGEVCRYLVAAPESEWDRKHRCIVAHGNGLRAEVWRKFQTRFNVPEIREFYRSTEGLAKFDNWGSGVWGEGKIGFAGPLKRYFETDTFIIKTDPVSGEVWRDPKTGLCTRAKLGEAGEAIGRVKDPGLVIQYLGNRAATEEKLLSDVFFKGDCYHRMGDLLVHDSDGWVAFHDRMGDTFRWKGENVSTGEVRDHIAKLPGVQDVMVYGVKLASYDGQAGAAAITIQSQSETDFMTNLFHRLKKTGLPSYAMPRLVRITTEIETTATFKKSKVDLVKKGWTSDEKDSLYWLNGSKYEHLDTTSWKSIETGRAKL